MRTALAGAGVLARLALRRDRMLIPAWIGVLVSMAWTSAAATAELYPDVASRVSAATAINATPVLVAVYGKIYDPGSLGAVALIKQTGLGTAMVAVMAILVTVRHTRADEETGRLELVGAGAVGRQAGLMAALGVAALASVALGVGTCLSLIAAGLPIAGSAAFGLGWTLIGVAFAALAGVIAQLATSARTATGVSVALVGALYAVRGVGDSIGSDGARWLSWLSPFGWQQFVRAYADERWLWLAPLAVLATLATASAFGLSARRDLGAGLLTARPGPARAGVHLSSTLGLAWRIQRAALGWWAFGFVLLGGVLGSIVSGIGDLLDSPQMRQFIELLGGEQALTDSFLAAEMGFVGVFTAAYAVSAAARLRAEEEGNRAEPVLAGAVSRRSWLLSHTVLAVAGAAVLLFAVGLSAGAAYSWTVGDADQIAPVVVAALVQVPAVWVLVGLVAAAYGWAARGVVVGWVALVFFVVIAEVGPLLKVDQWVLDLSPFARVPQLPGGDFAVMPLIWLLAVAGGLLAVGLAGVRRRDLA